MDKTLKKYYHILEDNFFGRWIKNFRISVLLTILLIWYGLYAALQIPKESSPEIKFGIVSVSTSYPWANPVDIDDLITTKIEDTVKDMNGIDSIESNSSVGFSNVVITLKNETDVKDFIGELKSEIDKVQLPTDAKSPIVSEISTFNELLFELMLYAPAKDFTYNHIKTLSYQLADALKGKWPIVDAKIWSVGNGGGRNNWSSSVSDNQFNVLILLDEQKMQQVGLSLLQVSQAIKAFNMNLPLGSHTLGELDYEYRIKGKMTSISELMNTPLTVPSRQNGPVEYIRLSDIAVISRDYKDKSVEYGWSYNNNANVATKVVIYKANRSNVFQNATIAREMIAKELQKPAYKGLQVDYTTDLADVISEDYKSLASNAWQSVTLIFLIMRLFVWLKQSIIATVAMPLSFFITFIFLNTYGYTLNFLTNFSLVLSFGMWIDTVVVIIEAAYELMKKWFDSKTAVLLALKQYAKPNITSSLANMVVFLPMLTLPWITGKFLAYIPITIFATLAASLFLALSINNALFWKINKNQKWYYKEKDYQEWEDEEILLSENDTALLTLERSWKEARDPNSQPWIDQKINNIAHWYSTKLHYVLENPFWRKMSFLWPIWALIISFIVLSPLIWFKLFPSGDNELMNITISTKIGTITDSLKPLITPIDQIISSLPEVRNYTIQADGNTINIAVRTVKKDKRTKNSFEIEKQIKDDLNYLVQEGYTVETKVQEGWPPVGKAIGIELIASDTNQLNQLKSVSKEFETFIQSMTGTNNISNSSKSNPGQFEFTRDRTKMAELWLTPNDFQWELLSALMWSNVWSISIENKERDMIVKYKWYHDHLTPEGVLATVINTKVGPLMLWSVAEYSINQSLNSVNRKDGNLTISVESDLDVWLKPTDFQPKLEEFARTYQFPNGITFKAWGENEANAELIQATMIAFIIAIFLTFLILVYQFNSYKQSLIILYSIITALLWVNIGLFITWNPYSMPFMIWFISLIGIVVNNAIFIIDKINSNIALWVWLVEAIVDAGKTRFKPVIISSMTTILGIITLARKDEFWAWLAYTVVFGLLFSSVMTLLSVPNIYYSVYRKKDQQK